jgi:glutathione S-transferase
MSAQYTLYIGSKSFSSWSLRPWLAMKTAGLPFQEELVTLRTPETKARIRALSPSTKLPALRIDENGGSYLVWDSLAICETLAERHPDAQLWPADPRTRAEARSMCAEMHSGFPDLRKTLPMDVTQRIPTPELEEDVRNQIGRIVAMWEGALKQNGGHFLCGPFSIADCYYAPVVTRFETYAIPLPAVAQAYCQRILALPAMKEWTAGAKLEQNLT